MASVRDHYRSHLAPIYLWMAGGAATALSAGEAELGDLLGKRGLALDLGAGFGMHAIPLARAGYRVIAVDTSELLLSELAALARSLPIDIRCTDLISFPALLPSGQKPCLILCMGDTLAHLDDLESVRQLARQVAASLEPGGRFVATFRDYTRLPEGQSRFIPVRNDEDRILTCFLEEQPAHVEVHDILHERSGSTWSMKISSYRKLRLAPEVARQAFEAPGLRVVVEPGPRGMQRLIADA